MTMTNEESIAEIWKLFREERERANEEHERAKEERERAREERERAKEERERAREERKRANEEHEQERKRAKEERKRANEKYEQERKEASAELDRRFRETDQEIKNIGKKIRSLAGSFDYQWGKLIEKLVKSGVVKLFQYRGIDIKFVTERMKRTKGGGTMEIDLLLLNTTEIVAIEVKSTLKVSDVDNFLEDLVEFKDFFPEYKGYHLYGGVVGLEITEGSDRYAYKQGLFVLGVQGKKMAEMRNDLKFKPKDFSQELHEVNLA